MEYIILLSAYLLGSIPFALLIGKITKGIDIRQYGSKNMGATNAVRVLGFKWGLLVFFLDALKAGFVILLFRLEILSYQEYSLFHPLIYGLIAIIGHFFPIFAKFKGGKGVACAAGVILIYHPITFLIGLFTFIITIIITKYVSVGSLFSSLIVFLTTFFLPNHNEFTAGRYDYWFIGFIGLMCVLIFISHRKNIIRLIKKTEPKINEYNKKKA